MTDQQSQVTGRRSVLNKCGHTAKHTNPSLWFDKFYKRDPEQEEAKNKQQLIEQTAGLGVASVYPDFYAGWKQVIEQQTKVLAIAEVAGRMVVGTGAKGVAEAGMTLHRTYGVPFIPGSALKGLTAAYASQYVERFAEPAEPAPDNVVEYEPYHILFGAPTSAGFLTFFDALFIPESAQNPLALDVVTGHHSGYYVGNDPKPPADWDSPIPAPFMTAVGRYLIAIGGDEAWARVALMILGCALRDLGVGAKTAAGYGRMRLLDSDEREMPLPTVKMTQEASSKAPTNEGTPPATSAAAASPTPTQAPSAAVPNRTLPQQPPAGVPATFWKQLRESSASNIDQVYQQWLKLDDTAKRNTATFFRNRALVVLGGEKTARKKKWFSTLSAHEQD